MIPRSEKPHFATFGLRASTAKCATAALLAAYGVLLIIVSLFLLQHEEEPQHPPLLHPLPWMRHHRRLAVQGTKHHTYTVCNGMSNQILCHVGNIAYAISMKMPLLIPDAYIIDGAQDGNADVTPSNRKYTPLASVFDTHHLLRVVRLFGIDARIVPYSEEIHGSLKCSWTSILGKARPDVAGEILQAFQASSRVKELVDAVVQGNPKSSDAICVHHRDGDDWSKHCERWEGLNDGILGWVGLTDGIWRKNCGSDGDQPLSAAVKKRLLPGEGPAPIFYVGDTLVPADLSATGFEVFTRGRTCADKFGLRDSTIDVPSASAGTNNIGILERNDLLSIVSQNRKPCAEGFRDICAIVDYHACLSMTRFIGNSVSTWSALQIAQREGVATSWYNSRSIPLADLYKVYAMPIVYTYTERSEGSGKAMLMASILSAKAKIPSSEIHILYNGYSDVGFRSWLGAKGVILHQHEPDWTPDIENMFKNGDERKSHLFKHFGNYLGTWQRIDIPKFINAEFALLLDCDTIVMAPFTFADFTKKMTKSIALSAEMEEDAEQPWNAGVLLMNLPYLRETYDGFLEFIKSHRENEPYVIKYRGSWFFTAYVEAPSDQGAYLSYYADSLEFLSTDFNDKPYYLHKKRSRDTYKIMHFHGAKPHDYLRSLMGLKCNEAVEFLCEREIEKMPNLCRSLKLFADALTSDDGSDVLDVYCSAAFSEQDGAYYDKCYNFFSNVAKLERCNKEVLQSLFST